MSLERYVLKYIVVFTTAGIVSAVCQSERSDCEAREGGGGVCFGVQFSRDSIRAFNDGIKIRENRGLSAGYYFICNSFL